MRTSSRAIPVALAAVLVFAACGSDEPDTTPIDPVDEPDAGSDDLRAPTPIEIAEGSSSGLPAATAEASQEVEVGADTGRMIAPVWIADYVVGDGMPALPTADTGYVYQSSGEPAPGRVAELAAVFGVSGEPQRFDEGFGVWWRVGPTDGSAPTVELQGDAQQSWYFSSPWAGEAVVACAVGVDSEGNEIGDCPEPEPPVGVPTAGDAEERAREYLTALGEDPDALVYETNADPWAAHVHVEDRVGAPAALRSWSFGFGAEGVLQWASGTSLRPEPVGPYPLIDLETALERLRSGSYGGFFGGPAVLEPAIATAEIAPLEEPAVEAGAPPSEGDVDGDVDGDVEMPGEPVEPMPEPEPITVTLVDVQPDLWWAWDVHGAIWLLPAYRFIDTDGAWYVVPAVTDDFLVEVPAPDVVEPAPEPLPAPEPEPVEPEPAPEPAPGPDGPVGIADVDAGVEFYPACGNETLTFDGVTWYQVHEREYPDVWERIFSVAREQPASPVGFRSVRVAPPGPGDDVGTLVVWTDGVAWFVSDSGSLEAWLVSDPLEYRWEC